MNGNVDGPKTGFVGDCMSQMMGMMPGGGLDFLRLIAVLGQSAAALVKYLRRPA